jgi:hypothetical protein
MGNKVLSELTVCAPFCQALLFTDFATLMPPSALKL